MNISRHISALIVLLAATSGVAMAQSGQDAYAVAEKLFVEKKYEEASKQYFATLTGLNKPGRNATTATSITEVLSRINRCYIDARKENVPFRNIKFDSTVTEEFYFTVVSVPFLDNDSAIVTINEGSQDGVTLHAECYLEGAYGASKGDTTRSLKFLGSARIIEVSDYSAKALVKFYKSKKGFKIFPNDMLDVYVHPVAGSVKGLLYELARLDIIFNDNAKETLMDRHVYFHNTDPAFEGMVMEAYTKEIGDFATDLDGYDGATFTTPFTGGRFKEYTMKQVFHNTSRYDVYSFFNFAHTYPGKYMGTAWKVNETYATWVMNNTPTGDKDREWLIPAIEHGGYKELNELLKRTTFYIGEDTLHAWDSKITGYLNVKNDEAAMALNDKLIYVAEYLDDTANIAFYHWRRAQIKRAVNNNKSALADMLVAYHLDEDNDNYKYDLASLYGSNELFDSSFILYDELIKKFPNNPAIKGYCGWFKTLAGKLDEAIPLCRFAYYSDTSSVSFAVNYGHTFLLKGNVDSAKYFYNKMLTNLNHPTDYTEGPKKDFELFFAKGWQRKTVAEIAEWMDGEFQKNYSYVTQGNLVWEDAKKYYDGKSYARAISKWKEYVAILSKTPAPNYEYIHNAYIWIAFSFNGLKEYDSTLAYYNTALAIATGKMAGQRGRNNDDDLIANDYRRLGDYYQDYVPNKKLADAYKLLYNAESQKLAEINSVSRLHVICIGGKDTVASNTYSVAAKTFYDNIVAIDNNKQAVGTHIYLDGAGLNKKTLVEKLDSIRQQSKPDDIFIFYYSGITASENDKEILCFDPADKANGKIDAKELLQDIDLVYAKKKMIITDDPDPSLLTLIAAQYTAQSNNANEIIFLCPGVKTPAVEGGCTMFTNELVNGLKDLKKKDHFSAKEFVDKASYALGRGEHYLPVLSFSYGKDFILYKNDSFGNNTVVDQPGMGRGLRQDADMNQAPSVARNSGPQKNYALFFASNEYEDANTWHQLSNPISDASALGAILEEDYGFQVEVVKNASKKEIENKLKEYRSKNYTQNDQLMIFFAGHGIYYQDANMGYLVAKDSKDPRSTDPNFDTYLSYSDLGNLYLKNIKCRRIFLVLDACYAGSFFEEKGFSRGGPDMNSNSDALKRLSMLKKNADGKTYYRGISSGGKETVEDGRKDQHSPFAGGLIQMLNSSISRSYVTADALIGDIQNNHPGNTTPSSGSFNYTDPQGLFIFEAKTQEQEHKQTLSASKF